MKLHFNPDHPELGYIAPYNTTEIEAAKEELYGSLDSSLIDTIIQLPPAGRILSYIFSDIGLSFDSVNSDRGNLTDNFPRGEKYIIGKILLYSRKNRFRTPMPADQIFKKLTFIDEKELADALVSLLDQ